MNELLNKISSYNLFNYLLPGAIFAALTGDAVHNPVAQRDIITNAFLYYFVGLVISRFGSLIIEPLLRRLSFIKFAEYKKFIEASKKDPQIDVLSEANNTYRTLCSMFTLLLLLKLFLRVESRFTFLKDWNATILTLLLLAMFLFSYRKQTFYITKRVKVAGEQ